ncbi:MCE family protein [Mycobacterium sp. AMU20-3851]|uniref:MCE family protein n=1 Tax=Mycobacterium sp. AMU20-3851 TaxID=3122055 RepID=UPI003754E485
MISVGSAGRALVVGTAAGFVLSGCAFHGVNSLPLPGVQGNTRDAQQFTVEVANVGTLESNSPVMIDDAVVGSVGDMTVDGWHAKVKVNINPGVVVPGNAVATVGQTSLLGSMHLALNAPVGESPSGQLQTGATIPLSDSSTYPSTEQTLSSLSTMVNGGGLGQIGDIIHNFSTAMSGRESEIRDLLVRLDKFVGTLDTQRSNIVASIKQLNTVAGTFASQNDKIDRALKDIPPALDVLIDSRPRFTTALQRLGEFSDTATGLVNDAGKELVRDLSNLEPALKALADIGPDINGGLAYASAFPYGPNAIERAVKGDFLNLFAVFDLTYPRIKRTLLLGTRWGDENATLIPAPGDPWYLNYSYSPLSAPIAPPPAVAPAPEGAPPPVSGPVLPVAPPPLAPQSSPPVPAAPIFAGPYAPAQGSGG